MQNFELLKELGRLDKPILLKRGLSSTIEELLMSAEYIMAGGNEKVILCERGIRTYETYTRNTLDISAVPILKKLSHLPVIVDPSHASGISWLVEPLALSLIHIFSFLKAGRRRRMGGASHKGRRWPKGSLKIRRRDKNAKRKFRRF